MSAIPNIKDSFEVGSEIVVGLTWYVVEEIMKDSCWCVDQEGGEKEIFYQQIDAQIA